MDKDVIITSLYHDPFGQRRRLRRLEALASGLKYLRRLRNGAGAPPQPERFEIIARVIIHN